MSGVDEYCIEDCERAPTCPTCHRVKQPQGRAAPLGSSYCGPVDCPDFYEEPTSGHLWPGELAAARAGG